MKAYMSLPKNTPIAIKSFLAEYIYGKLSELDLAENNMVDWWVPNTAYSTAPLETSDIIYVYIPSNKTYHDNDTYCFVGKGQSSEIDLCQEERKDYIFLLHDIETDAITECKFVHSVPEDYDDWKEKYTKVWIEPINEIDKEEEIEFINNFNHLML